MPKQFLYRGKTLEELQRLSISDFAALADSRIRRKIRKGFTDAEKIFMENVKKRGNVKTHCRDAIVLPFMVGKMVYVHTGKAFDPVMITEEMIGHRLGEFALTRRKVAHNAPGIGATRSSAAMSVK